MNLWRTSLHASLLIREQPWYRRGSFEAGLRAAGYTVDNQIRPAPDNLLVVWNRYGHYDVIARQYEEKGGKVIVAENGYLGREWNDGHWYCLSLGQHNTIADWQLKGDTDRAAKIGIELLPWRISGSELVVLGTRGIGPNGVKEPPYWAQSCASELSNLWKLRRPVRFRAHPGENKCVPLEQDLRDAKAVLTWGSGGALKALVWGIPVFYGYKHWIGSEAAANIKDLSLEIDCRQSDRETTFRRVAWSMWNTKEIETGEPFKWLLQ